MEKSRETEIFENMPVRKAVYTLAVPTVISQLIILVYNLAGSMTALAMYRKIRTKSAAACDKAVFFV